MTGDEIEYSMALVILGGLVTSTILNLFLTPALILRWGGVGEVSRSRMEPSTIGISP